MACLRSCSPRIISRQLKHAEKVIGEKIKRIKELLRNPKNKENLPVGFENSLRIPANGNSN
jgi:hypothetical protein